jgi:adenylate kinase
MIIILGTPGAGKTTQARLLSERLNCPWFSTGQLIRDNVSGRDRQDMLAGKIIDDKVTLRIIDKVLKEQAPDGKCIFEGSPRTTDQAKWWLEQTKKGRFGVEAVIHLVADPAIAAKRLVNRGRLDDHNDNVVATRFAEYHRSITPTLDYLKSHGISVHNVDANGTIDEEAELIQEALGL